ncbi:hypothetical protein HYN59_11975 [Flavobacterium album]|uniref:Uncharacterized protein n=1 Tax=Flavobacterium album TaxID=2175091 RepID=A0A2S1QZE3_9FLAO|nr:gliding motility-associated C-terminal domain-containing protein [Flavobacterium album]AWH85783.1 hypothetical protein HYN59_11975 [Flavobacterium album]
MERKITHFRLILLLTFLFVIKPGSYAQVYMHNFGTTNITTHPYTVAPTTLNPDLSGSSWSNSTGAWTNLGGATGEAIALNDSGGSPTITLTFNVAAGKTLDITSFSFWRRRSNTGAQNWTMTINGVNVGNGNVPTTGAAIPTTTVANPVNGLTGNVTVMLSLSGATGSGTFRLDDFTLNGNVNAGCTAPVISSFSPASGPSNTLVTITGSGFSAGTTSVKFGGVEASGFTVVTDTQIKAIVADGAPTGAVTVTTNACTGTSGTFTMISSNCPAFVGPNDLFISEIYDAEAGEGGAIELYNGTNATIDLSLYSIVRHGTINGPATFTLNLTGMLAPGGINIVRTATSVCGLTGTPINLLPSGFNDSDKLELVKNTVVIDVVNTPSNVGFSMIRNANAQVPSATYNAADWAISDTEDCSNLGIHNITSSSSDHISAQPLSAAVCEGDNVQYTVTLSAASTFTYQWKMLNASGNWVNITDGDNFLGANTVQLTVIDTPLEFNGAQFYCVATSAGCTLISNAVQLTVSPLPLAVVIPVAPTCAIPTGGLLIMPSVGDGLTYSIDGVNFQPGLAFNGIAPGSYTLTIKSSANCVSLVPFTIVPAPLAPAVATFIVTQPTCTTATGTITVDTSADPTLTYSLDGSTFQSGGVFSGLTPGNYTITSMTALGCTSVTATITINPAPTSPAVATTTVAQPTCTTATGTITVTNPTTPAGEYTYSIDGTTFQASPVFANLAPGNYTVTTQNSAGCNSVTPTITINAVPVVPGVATTTVTQPTCTTATGSIVVDTPAGFTYSIDGTTFQSSNTFSNLAPGTYTITTQATGGCTSVTAAITINAAPTAPAVATTTVTQPDCTTSGSIEVTFPTGGDLTYSIDGTTFQASPVFANVAPGNYTVTTKNGAGCTSATATITINTVPGAPSAAVTTLTQPTCATPTGTIEVTAPLGAFTYSIDGTNFQNTTTFANLAPGTYTVTTQNAGGCTSTASVTINAVPAGPAVATTTLTQPTCTTPTGTIEVTAPTGAFTYSIDGTTFQSSTTFAGLAPGNYTVTTQNTDGCTSTASVTIDAVPTGIAAAATTVTQPTCSMPTGTIVVDSPTGAGFSYSIDGTNFQTSTTFANLAPGSYTITTQTSGGCTSVSSAVTINAAPGAPAVATTMVTQPNCTGITTGTIEVTAPTGAGFTYSIDGVNFQATTTFANLAPGTYTLTTDNAGCQSVATITINPVPTVPAVATTTPTQPTCAVPTGTIVVNTPTGTGFTYSIDGTNFQSSTTFAGLAGGAYIVTVMNAGGCTSTTGFINIDSSPIPAVATTDVTQPTCFNNVGRIDVTGPTGSGFSYSIDGTNFQSGTGFINLAPGDYTITVKNISGCTSTATVTVNAIPETPVAATTTLTQPDCATGMGAITIAGPLGSQYSYSIDGTNYQSATTFAGLDPGNYTISVMSDGGCKSPDATVTLNAPVNNIAITGSQGCEGGGFENSYMLNASVTGADESTATFVWTDANGAQVGTGTKFDATEYADSNSITPELYPIDFTLTVTTPGGCSTDYTFTVDGTFCDIPRGISPNADNKNDNFDISGMGAKKLSIFNRYGEEVYSKNDYTNQWYGQTDNGDELPTGTYFYVIERPGQSRTGWVYVNRQQ